MNPQIVSGVASGGEEAVVLEADPQRLSFRRPETGGARRGFESHLPDVGRSGQRFAADGFGQCQSAFSDGDPFPGKHGGGEADGECQKFRLHPAGNGQLRPETVEIRPRGFDGFPERAGAGKEASPHLVAFLFPDRAAGIREDGRPVLQTQIAPVFPVVDDPDLHPVDFRLSARSDCKFSGGDHSRRGQRQQQWNPNLTSSHRVLRF